MPSSTVCRERYFSGLHLAAYITWAAVAYGVWLAAARWEALGPLPARAAAMLLLGAFLVAFVGGTAATGAARSRLSLAAMAASVMALLWLGRSGTAPVLLIIFASVATVALSRPQAVAALIVVNAAFLAIMVWRWEASNPLPIFVILCGFQAFAALVSDAMARAEAMALELKQVNARLLATRSLLAESARDGERLRVSRELHDVAGHKLTALKLNLEALARDQTLEGRRELGVSRQLAAELLDDVRSVVSSLRRDEGIDLAQSLERLAEPFPRPRVHLDVARDARVADTERAEVLLRAAQEGLTNAARHAGAGNVWLSLRSHDGDIELVVEDDGAFGGEHEPGHGLTGMHERVRALGGTLDAGRGPRGGFRLAARLPRERVA